MSEQEQVATVRGVYEAFARGDIPGLLDRLDPDVEWQSPPSVPFSKGLHRGPDDVAQFFAGIVEYIAEPTFEVEELLTAGDRVVVLGCFRGRGRESGEAFEAREAHFWKLARGKIVRHESYADTAAIVQSLGTAAAVA